VPLDAAGVAVSSPVTLPVGSHDITAIYNPPAAFSPSTSTAVSVVGQPEATSVTLTPSASTAIGGQTVTLTAAVTASNSFAGTATGTVTFMDGSTALATVSLDSSGKAVTSPLTLAVGTHSLTAVYNPTAAFATSSSAPLSLPVTTVTPTSSQEATTVTLTSSVGSATTAQTLTLNATVTAANTQAGVATGNVTFFDGTTPLGTVAVDGNGNATSPTLTLAAGSHSLTAVYTPTGSFLGNTSSVVSLTITTPPASATPSPSGIGEFDPATGNWYLRTENNAGSPDAGSFAYGTPGWVEVVGDWDGNGTTTIGVVDTSTATWYLRNENSAGAPDAGQFAYGMGSWQPVAGVWTAPAQQAQAMAAQVTSSSDALLTQTQLQDAVSAALQRLTQAGVGSATLAQLQSASYSLGSLPGSTLGQVNTTSKQVVLSANGAGNGWFSDATPQSDGAFSPTASSSALGALPTGPAAGKEDLLTAVMYEMSQLAGRIDSADLTTAILPVGVREVQTMISLLAS
jgi:hypothetical protein